MNDQLYAFAAGQHSRLGADSPVYLLDAYTIREILTNFFSSPLFALVKDDRLCIKKWGSEYDEVEVIRAVDSADSVYLWWNTKIMYQSGRLKYVYDVLDKNIVKVTLDGKNWSFDSLTDKGIVTFTYGYSYCWIDLKERLGEGKSYTMNITPRKDDVDVTDVGRLPSGTKFYVGNKCYGYQCENKDYYGFYQKKSMTLLKGQLYSYVVVPQYRT